MEEVAECNDRAAVCEERQAGPIGVAASRDWRDRRFLGCLNFDGVNGRLDMRVTDWAPGILCAGDRFRRFVT